MEEKNVIIIFKNHLNKTSVDLEVPLDITIYDLIIGLNEAYDLKIDTSNMSKCHLKIENPIMLLRGNKTLKECGIRQGSIINYTGR